MKEYAKKAAPKKESGGKPTWAAYFFLTFVVAVFWGVPIYLIFRGI